MQDLCDSCLSRVYHNLYHEIDFMSVFAEGQVLSNMFDLCHTCTLNQIGSALSEESVETMYARTQLLCSSCGMKVSQMLFESLLLQIPWNLFVYFTFSLRFSLDTIDMLWPDDATRYIFFGRTFGSVHAHGRKRWLLRGYQSSLNLIAHHVES